MLTHDGKSFILQSEGESDRVDLATARMNASVADDAAKKALAEAERSVALSHAKDSRYTLPVPEGLSYRGYQKAGIVYSYERWIRDVGVLIADEMGLGKTVQAIGAINVAGDAAFPAIIVCPAHLRANWLREIGLWLTQRHRTIHVCWDGNLPANEYGDIVVPDILVINYQRLKGRWFDYITSIPWGAAVVDEIHFCKNQKSARTKKVFGYYTKTGAFAPGVFNVARFKMGLTGTPIENRTFDLWPLVHALAPKVFDNESEFQARYCGCADRDSDLQDELRSTVMIRRLMADVESEMPEDIRQLLVVKAEDAETQKLIEREKSTIGITQATTDEDFEKLVESMESGADPIKFSEVSRIRAELGVRKAPYVAQMSQMALDTDLNHKVVIFIHHKKVAQYLLEYFKQYGCKSITGDTPQQMRDEIVAEFRAGFFRVMVLSLDAAGTGSNLQFAWHIDFGEVAWKPSTNEQAIGRIKRIGQSHKMLVRFIMFDGSVDARMMELNLKKKKKADAVLDRRKE